MAGRNSMDNKATQVAEGLVDWHNHSSADHHLRTVDSMEDSMDSLDTRAAVEVWELSARWLAAS
jgi:hypothetical protein